ncbi:cytochrome b/b6 domain-containing protein [Rhodoplanes sp. Z2-YC6860]|uniref:cytochrome b/b6 domain-containing protein n=1 Tax=Rhodoplanes sp. Z2-YC6860 TaxID=674703 RepID=UPI00078ECF7A|nr:cytochrome b/b6 domain-containing protein [Rhodoplanes sp. Z2-YC6860]AMN39556.1 Cytochrome b561 family protein [Rhodoplanes sp. Z2-YC6860]
MNSLDKNPPAQSFAPAVVVWDWPLRLIHWTLAASTLIAWFTANIFDTVHEIAGYTVIVLLVLRMVWAFAGNRYARLHGAIRPLRITLQYLRQLTRGETGRYLGLNPAGAAMAVVLILSLAVSSISGWMQITERYFGDEWVERVHTWSSNLVLGLAIVHVLGVLLVCGLQKENLVRAMITGKKRPR